MNPTTIPLTFFRKTSGSISGPFDDIVRPAHVRFLDYEVEIGLVIGRELPVGTRSPRTTCADYVAGLVVTNDVSARDVQLPKTQFYESKSYPTFTPVGPALVLLDADELKRFGDLRLRLWVNGELRQDTVVDGDMIYRPLQALQALTPVPAAGPRRPAADRHPGRHRPERPAEAGRDHRRPAAARGEVEGLLQAAGQQPQVPSGTATSSKLGVAHRRRRHRPRLAAHRREVRVTLASLGSRRHRRRRADGRHRRHPARAVRRRQPRAGPLARRLPAAARRAPRRRDLPDPRPAGRRRRVRRDLATRAGTAAAGQHDARAGRVPARHRAQRQRLPAGQHVRPARARGAAAHQPQALPARHASRRRRGHRHHRPRTMAASGSRSPTAPTEREHAVDADYVLGCDGANSVVRAEDRLRPCAT